MESQESGQGLDAASLFGRRLQHLVDTVRPGGQPYTDTEIAARVGVSSQYISNLRRGKSVPSLDKAMRLARLFHLPHADLFLADAPLTMAPHTQQGPPSPGPGDTPPDEGDEQLNEVWDKLKRNPRLQDLAVRFDQLDPLGQDALITIIDQILAPTPAPQ